MKLQQEYSYTKNTIYSTTLFPQLKQQFILFKIESSRTKYRIKSAKIQQLFKEHNLTVQTGKIRYVNFVKLSPINTSGLALQIKKRYEAFYPNLYVKQVHVTPRNYLKELDPNFDLILHTKNLKHAHGIFSIKTSKKERLFFNYEVDGVISIYMALHPLQRGETLSPLNAVKKEIKFKNFNALPLEHIHTKEYRLKRSVKKNHILTLRDVEAYPIVKKGNSVLVQLQSGSVVVEFSAIASQDGSKNDIISVQKKDGHRIKARVIAPGRVEIQ
jgi:flagella basal body P-ring formation protein FlgA